MNHYPKDPGYAKDSDTSLEAAKRIAKPAASIRRRALNAVDKAGPNGLTTIEVAKILRLDHHTVGSRIAELKRDGCVRDSGQRRLNPSGVKATVWTAAR